MQQIPANRTSAPAPGLFTLIERMNRCICQQRGESVNVLLLLGHVFSTLRSRPKKIHYRCIQLSRCFRRDVANDAALLPIIKTPLELVLWLSRKSRLLCT